MFASDCVASKMMKYTRSKIIEDELVKRSSWTKLSSKWQKSVRDMFSMFCFVLFIVWGQNDGTLSFSQTYQRSLATKFCPIMPVVSPTTSIGIQYIFHRSVLFYLEISREENTPPLRNLCQWLLTPIDKVSNLNLSDFSFQTLTLYSSYPLRD